MIGPPTRVVVDAAELHDLLELVDSVLAHATEDRVIGVVVIRGPIAEYDSLRAAAAQLRCSALEPA